MVVVVFVLVVADIAVVVVAGIVVSVAAVVVVVSVVVFVVVVVPSRLKVQTSAVSTAALWVPYTFQQPSVDQSHPHSST